LEDAVYVQRYYFIIFMVVLGFKFRVLHMLDRLFVTGATPPAHFA
jgi:hypothetical protein